MYTIELSYILLISVLSICCLLNGTIQYHQELYKFTAVHMEEELKNHSEGNQKTLYQPEKLMRMGTLLEDWVDEADEADREESEQELE